MGGVCALEERKEITTLSYWNRIIGRFRNEKGKCWGKKRPPGGLCTVCGWRRCCLGWAAGQVTGGAAGKTKHCPVNCQLRKFLFLLLLAGPTHSLSPSYHFWFLVVSYIQRMAVDEDMEALRKISTASSCPTESSFARNSISFFQFNCINDWLEKNEMELDFGRQH